MKKIMLIITFLLIISGIFLAHKKEFTQTRRNYNVYIKSGNTYVKSNSNELPKIGYVLNTTESSCTNGGVLSQDSVTKIVSITTTKETKCNLYFDVQGGESFNKLKSLNSNITLKSGNPDFTKNAPLPDGYADNGITGTETYATVSQNTRYITYATSYSFNSSTGKYTLTNPQTCRWNSCYSSLAGNYICSTTVSTSSSARNYSDQTNLYQVTSNSTSSRIYYRAASISDAYDTSEVGIYKLNDDYGDSIYFRGNIEYNYVRYGKDSNNNDMFWRIIRINGDGTLRMIYDGTSAHANGESSNNRVVGTSAYNSESGSPYDAGYVGYMYGSFTAPSTSYAQAHANTNSSTIKTYVENWYLQNIVNTGYSVNVADSVFCNDRTLRTGDLGYGVSESHFGPYNRSSSSNSVPSLSCIQKNDAFTVSDTNYGNGKLTYPVGLVTTDELVAAGNSWSTNHNTYLYKGSNYWSMSPGMINSSAYVMILNPSDYSNAGLVSGTGGVAPVINLKASTVQSFTGNGTMQNPFHLN